MVFHIITIFPKIFDSYFGESIIKRACEKKLINISVVNLRDFASDKHKTVDDTPFGGGAGMILKIEPICKAIEALKSQIPNSKTHIVLFSAKGKRYTQADAKRLAKYGNLIFICGRYEGVDERAAKHIADEEISIGDYVLSGGEIPAMVLLDSISRLIPGVLGNPDSLKDESFNKTRNPSPPWRDPAVAGQPATCNTILEYPQYTRPEIFNNWKVPKVLLSGNHKEIESWKIKNSKNVV
ncbi:MAG: tRNA (guanosine(37)-N1)-methyltransferase TrmD [bacterium]|nr:tRNA (guanosine(37)-N1)-methyltransferase TrmD [bacterium]